MYNVVYVSTQTKPLNEHELEALLVESRDWNNKVGITGLLLNKYPNFMQFLEGPKADVLELLGKIRTDPRHHSVIVLVERDLVEREFSDWLMGFESYDPNIKRALGGYTDLWELPFTSEEFLLRPENCLQLLKSFRFEVHAAVPPATARV